VRLVDDLRRDFGEDAVWYDKLGGLNTGDEWWSKIRTELRTRPVFIPVLSPDAMASPWVNDEMNLAWVQRNTPDGKFIIPLIYQPCTIRDDINTLRNKVSFVSNSYESAYEQLIKQLKVIENRLQAAQVVHQTPVSSPPATSNRLVRMGLVAAVALLALSALGFFFLTRSAEGQRRQSNSRSQGPIPTATATPSPTLMPTAENPTVVYTRIYSEPVPGPCSANHDAALWKASDQSQNDDTTMQTQQISAAYICNSDSVELAIVPQVTFQDTSITFVGNAGVPLPPHHSQQCEVSGIGAHTYVQIKADGVYLQINGDGTYGYFDGSATSLFAGHLTITSSMTIKEVYNGTKQKFYVNGALLVQFSAKPPQNSQGMVILLGAYNPTGPNLTRLFVKNFSFTPILP
jgi:hypothetical protein